VILVAAWCNKLARRFRWLRVCLDGMVLTADLQGLEGEAVRSSVTYRVVFQRL
jgi:hypothetical protein